MPEILTREWADRWGSWSEHYERFRPGPPESYYQILAALGCGLPGQRVLDMGTGPGLLACELALRGAQVVAVDRAEEQIAQARQRALRLGVEIEFKTGKIEDVVDRLAPVDLAIANMSWLYFDQPRVLDALLSNLPADGRLAISRFNAVYSHPMVELAVETLRDFGFERGERPQPGPFSHDRFTTDERFELCALVYYEEPIKLTIEAWVGRWLASMPVTRKMAAANTDAAAFAKGLREKLEATVRDPFSVPHFVNLEVYRPRARDA